MKLEMKIFMKCNDLWNKTIHGLILWWNLCAGLEVPKYDHMSKLYTSIRVS